MALSAAVCNDLLRTISAIAEQSASVCEKVERVAREMPATVAVLGGAILLLALLTPIPWFHQESTGGLSGEGLPGEDKDLNARDAFGAWVIAIAIPAAAPVADLIARAAGRSVPWSLRLGLVLLGLAILVVVSWVELSYELPPCCDLAYVRPSPMAGFLFGAIGATLLLFGTLAASPGRQRAGSNPPST